MPDDSPQRPDDARPDQDPTTDGEPTRFRVADTGWPPSQGSGDTALPRRTPGASGGPGALSASGDDPSDDPPPAEPADVRSGWVTSPPLEDEPWAGLPAAPGEDVADTPTAPGAGPAAEASEAWDHPDLEAEPDDGSEVAAEATRKSGRHRGPKGRHGRPRRGLRRHAEAAIEPRVTDSPLATASPASLDGSDTAESVAVGAEVEPARGHAARARSRRPALTWPATRLGLLALAVVAVLVFGVLNLVVRVWPGPPGNPYESASTKAAIAAATAVAAPILSYDYTTIDKKAAQLAPLQTITCATQYGQLLTSTVKPLAVQNKAKQQAAVLAAGVTTASKNAVTVLAFMQLTSSNSVKKGTAINEAQISVSMVRQHGKWLLAGTSANGASNGGSPSCGGANPAGS